MSDPLRDRTLPIEGYAAIGNGRTVALVGNDGSIDWCCLPRIDDAPVLDRLLDAPGGSCFALHARGGELTGRRYVDKSNVLESTVRASGGSAVITDHVATARDAVVRTARGVDGEIELRCVWRSRADAVVARGESRAQLVIASDAATVRVTAPSPWRRAPAGHYESNARLRRGQHASWILETTEGPRSAGPDDPFDPFDPLDDAATSARSDAEWAAAIHHDGPFAAAVTRSALALRLLAQRPTGAIAAAATTSLPEVIGGARNWDYRYCWMRDAALVLDALMGLGLHASAMRFWEWIQSTCRGDDGRGELDVLYTVDGRRCPDETIRDDLPGYLGSRPVRSGNAAARQEQNDLQGYLLDAAWRCQDRMDGPHPGLAPLLRDLADHAADGWREPGQGLWEIRGPHRHFVHSKLMSWVALDRALRLADRGWLSGDIERWKRERAAIREAILEHGYDRRRGTFVQTFGEPDLDASLLRLPVFGFLPADDPRVLGTIDAVTAELGDGDLVYRYRVDDGLPGAEGAFVACSFWRVEALALAGRRDAAHDLMERLVARTNDVGLLAEEIAVQTGAFLGNFPQAFSHVALIRAAVALRDDEDRR